MILVRLNSIQIRSYVYSALYIDEPSRVVNFGIFFRKRSLFQSTIMVTAEGASFAGSNWQLPGPSSLRWRDCHLSNVAIRSQDKRDRTI